MRLIDADKIQYAEFEQPRGNGNYETVKVAFESDIDAMAANYVLEKDISAVYKVVLHGGEWEDSYDNTVATFFSEKKANRLADLMNELLRIESEYAKKMQEECGYLPEEYGWDDRTGYSVEAIKINDAYDYLEESDD